ncbi:hypothetical protein [Microcoleus anatoxicus]|uniref:Uncharacterized protein n=1 Tax=Microcoleus anatoxicus PTRS2 TaxID=2705321 RepID=A0ABU8YKA4_9CYAN
MKTEHNYIGVANYSETRYEFENEIEWLEFYDELAPAQERFNEGKFDALFLLEPKSRDFDYLCGWHWQTDKLIQELDQEFDIFYEF